MRNIIIASVLSIATTTAAMAESPKYKLTVNDPKPECTNTDIALGVGVGIVGGAVIGVSSIIGAPVVGAAAGTTMTWGMAASAPFLANATATTAAGGAALAGPLVGSITYYVSCVTRETHFFQKLKARFWN